MKSYDDSPLLIFVTILVTFSVTLNISISLRLTFVSTARTALFLISTSLSRTCVGTFLREVFNSTFVLLDKET